VNRDRALAFRVEAEPSGTARLIGAISFANAASALSCMPLPKPRGAVLALDLAGLEQPDSATLAVLIAWAARAHREGVEVRFQRAPESLRRLARLCEVDALLGLG
jgi:phospholipid transport system transporter-binding protein